MASNVTNRSVKRLALAALLRTALIGSGKPTQKVYDDPIHSFPEQVAVVLESDGTDERQIEGISERSKAWFHIRIHTFVIWTLPIVGGVTAEDTLDLLEKSIADVLIDNVSTSDWAMIEYTGKTEPEIVILGQNKYEYRHEVISIRIRAYDN